MEKQRCVVASWKAVMVFAVVAARAQEIATSANGIAGYAEKPRSQLRGSAIPERQVSLRFWNNASVVVTFANCHEAHAVGSGEEVTFLLSQPAGSWYWAVPQGMPWTCTEGCAECFYVCFGVERSGVLVSRLGHFMRSGSNTTAPLAEAANAGTIEDVNASQHLEVAKEWPKIIAGVDFAAMDAFTSKKTSVVCTEKAGESNWERDVAVAWRTTVEFRVVAPPPTQGFDKPLLGCVGGGVGGGLNPGFQGVHPGFLPGFHGANPGLHGLLPGYGGQSVFFRPTVVRPWAHPLYPTSFCSFCSTQCLHLCSR